MQRRGLRELLWLRGQVQHLRAPSPLPELRETLLLVVLQVSVIDPKDEDRSESEGLQTLSRRPQPRGKELIS